MDQWGHRPSVHHGEIAFLRRLESSGRKNCRQIPKTCRPQTGQCHPFPASGEDMRHSRVLAPSEIPVGCRLEVERRLQAGRRLEVCPRLQVGRLLVVDLTRLDCLQG